MAYQAWVTNAQTVLRRRREEQARRDGPGRPPTGACARVRGRGWGALGQGLTSTPVRRRRPGPGGGAGGRPRRDHGSWYVHPGAGGLRGGEAGAGGVSASHPAGRGPVMRRVLSTVQFLWVLAGALVDGLTDWLLTFTRHHRAMSDVLRAERYLYTQELLRVRACGPSTPGAPPPPLGPRLYPGAPPPPRGPASRNHCSQHLPHPHRADRCTAAWWTNYTSARPRPHRQDPWGPEMHQVRHQGRCWLEGPGSGAAGPTPPGQSRCAWGYADREVCGLLAPCAPGTTSPLGP